MLKICWKLSGCWLARAPHDVDFVYRGWRICPDFNGAFTRRLYVRRSADNETSRVARPAGALPSNTLSGLSNDRSVSAHAQRDNNRGKSRCWQPRGRRQGNQHHAHRGHAMRIGIEGRPPTKHPGHPLAPLRRAPCPQHHGRKTTIGLPAVQQRAVFGRSGGAEAHGESVWSLWATARRLGQG